MSENVNISYLDFRELMEAAVREALPKDCSVILQSVRKNNDVCHDALHISRSNAEVSPVIYLEAYYKQYLRSGSMESAVSDFLRTYYESISYVMGVDLERELLTDVRDKIIFRVINYEMNRHMLENLPHVRLHDLAVIFLLNVGMGADGTGTAKITHGLMQRLNVGYEELITLALKNTERLYPKEIMSFSEYAEMMAKMGSSFSKWECEDMYDFKGAMEKLLIVTNSSFSDGAGVMLYPRVAEECSKRLGGSIILIPSSTNEWLVLPETENSEFLANLSDTIRFVNNTEVSKGEVLSYRYYRYPDESFDITDLKIEK